MSIKRVASSAPTAAHPAAAKPHPFHLCEEINLGHLGLYPKREHIHGDVNLDGKVNINDVTDLISYLLAGNADGYESADVNGDGKVNIDDVTDLINILLN